MRIGLLLPNSLHIDRLAVDVKRCFGHGLRSFGNVEVELVIETTSHNEAAKQVEAKLLDMIIKDDVEAIVLPLNPGLIPAVADIAMGQQIPIVVLTMGEDVFFGDVQPPWVFSISLNLWRSAWLMGWWAVNTWGPSVVVFGAAHDGGYGLSAAFARGVEAAGGSLLATVPGSFDPSAADAQRCIESVSDLEPDFHALLASGPSLQFLEAARLDLAITTPSVALPPIAYTNGSLATDGPAIGPSCPSIAAIDPTSESALNFVDEFVNDTGRPAHVYALLAYESGCLMADALARLDGQRHGAALSAALAKAEFRGPRGLVSFHADTQEVVTGQYLLTLSQDSSGQAKLAASAAEIPALLETHVADARTNADKQGWLNPYLIA